MRRMSSALSRLNAALRLALALGLAAYLIYFVAHAWLMLNFPFPLDYGEGPLLAQADLLRGGLPFWRLYADPALPPYAIVNYPPLYLLLTAALSPLVGGALAAGRLLSLLAAAGCVAALYQLADGGRRRVDGRRGFQLSYFSFHISAFAPLLLLTVPIVREWSALMRVDMLGLCLGLWGLVTLQMADGRWQIGRRSATLPALLSGVLFLACLFTKPSLIAGPGAGCLWLGWLALRAEASQRRAAWAAALGLWATLGLGGVLLLALLQRASGGWFVLHVVTANANRWDLGLALGFWQQQLALRWPLFAAAAVAALWLRSQPPAPNTQPLALLYTLLGGLAAIGVGKVGAYNNYFLELYAGLIWLIALPRTQAVAPGTSNFQIKSAGVVTTKNTKSAKVDETFEVRDELRALRALRGYTKGIGPSRLSLAFSALLLLALIFYPPLWDPDRLRQAGLLAPNPARLAFGRYGLLEDQRREAVVLAALGRVHSALRDEARAAGPLIFTDMPGIAAQAGVASRLQVFEQRQLYDQGLADQADLLRELANGELPLATIDFLGNWLTPEAIELLQRRYAHDGSLGTTDLFRPVDPGPLRPLSIDFASPAGPLRLSGYQLAPPIAQTYEPGELVTLALHWERPATATTSASEPLTVQIRLLDSAGATMLQTSLPLLYGIFPPAKWPLGAPMQHLQPFALPDSLPAGSYQLEVGLSVGGGPAQQAALTTLDVAPAGGRRFAETGYFVPGRVMLAWAELGGFERAGLPLTPLVPFSWGRLQCFERTCLELRADDVRQRPLGERLYLAETLRANGCDGADQSTATQPCHATETAAERFGAATLGPPISGAIERYGYTVQWTRYARIERAPASGAIGLGRLGDDVQRLAPGQPYRWP